MLRWLLNITFVLFLLLSLLTAGLWAFSAQYCISWEFIDEDMASALSTDPGRIIYCRGTSEGARWHCDVSRMDTDMSAGLLKTLRCGLEKVESFEVSQTSEELWVSLPIGWFWIGTTFCAGLLGAYLLLRRRTEKQKQNRIRSGLCPKCAYDLRANKDRCPECGTPIGQPDYWK
jgi:hypothetical protein